MKKITLINLVILLTVNLNGCVFERQHSNPPRITRSAASPTIMVERTIPTEEAIATQHSKPTGQPKLIATALIVTPLPPTPTATQTPLPKRPSVTPTVTRTPIVTDRVTACPGAPAILNRPETWVQISLYPPVSNYVRLEPSLNGEPIGKLKAGEVALIEAGPRCADDFTWWFVRSLTGLKGWTAEGDAANYWLIQPLDAFFYDTVDQSSTAHVVLNEGQKYRIILSGTYSLWIPQQWTDRGVCIRGEAEPLPKFPSPGKMNGLVGADPFYRFARPFYGPCQELTDPNETISTMMFSLDGGNSYSIPVPMVSEYRPDHTYTYEVIGQGQPLMVRLDDAPLDDNYGQIFVVIEILVT